MFRRTFIFAAIVSLVAGCSHAPQGAMVNPAAALQARAVQTKADFVAAAKSKGVKLTDADLAVIQAERQVTPNGTWAPRPAENLTAEANLDVHFKKHGHEFHPAVTSAPAYQTQGNAAGMGKRGTVRFFFDTTSFQKGYQSHVIRWVPTTHDFTAFRADGAETTYYQNDPKPTRFIEVPTW
ncbi:MAG: hypothetical protein JWM80_2932 [Cyanobacteria bacterium RYN_339]|nr:hypothetical protein [Cyanobacteria bacterium RYN_339]